MDWFATNYCMDLILVLVNGVMVYSGTRPSIACLFIKIGEKYYIVSKHQATVTGDRARHPYTHSISLTLPPRPAKRHCLNSRLMRSQTTAGDEATLSKTRLLRSSQIICAVRMISPFIFFFSFRGAAAATAAHHSDGSEVALSKQWTLWCAPC